ncbi:MULTISPECIES: nuclear transport factor 2 family protein [Salinivibrio]|uniref:Nuclear transport factor 2 family protein n=2 Tax=Salinivibrio TaxID=51366 RepID=A0AA47KNP4_9GAMM|nr:MULTISPECIES: nuclear transport factor 2 family protein [Salinivibrio]OOE88016.1 transcriptional regulator [Salinivibrio sharmensis]WBA10231.1 nuclear transport factor 2 family protein [Salinivibrio kushneri]
MTRSPTHAGVSQFVTTYQALNKDNLSSLATIYHPKIVFVDPAHEITGLEAFIQYFSLLYENVTDCQFHIHTTAVDGDDAFVTWTMMLSHPKLDGGKTRQVQGCSHLRFYDGKIIRHRDYFDLGEMLYEALPVIGRLLKHIKTRLGQ